MPDWPAPVEIVNPGGASSFVLLCEHASNHIPAEYDGLGLSKHDQSRHIACDIGAAEVARRLSALIDAPAFIAGLFQAADRSQPAARRRQQHRHALGRHRHSRQCAPRRWPNAPVARTGFSDRSTTR
ncbi:MAG: N-formylglutamate amidohydrolase [Asticcacaulis sp.]